MSTIGTLAPDIFPQYGDANLNPLSGGTIDFYAAGTTTHQDTFSDVGLTTPNANPVVLNSAGRPASGGTPIAIYFTPGSSYKAVLKDSGGVVIATRDNVGAIPAATADVDVAGTAGEALSAGDAVYLSDGTGALTTGRWYKTDADLAYASTTAGMVGFAVAAIASGAIGAIRIAGRLTGLSGLAIGSPYYLSGTAGAITATAPANARFVGVADSLTTLVLAPNPQQTPVAATNNGLCQGRLTLTSGTAVTTGDVTAAVSAYFTPFRGNRIALYDGTSRWTIRTFTEITISLVGLTAATPYDVFAYDNAGVVAIETLAWTSATARATALALQDGIAVKTGATTRRYVGSIYINASGGQTDDTAAKRYVFNAQQRVDRGLSAMTATATWTYATDTWRQANAAAANQVEVMQGLAEDSLSLAVVVSASNSAGGQLERIGIGEDSTTAPQAKCLIGATTNSTLVMLAAQLATVPAVGRHTYTWLEKVEAGGTTTFSGTSGGVQSGMTGIFKG